MKHIWERLTLMNYATKQNTGKITLDKWLAVLVVGMVIAATWRIAIWVIQN